MKPAVPGIAAPEASASEASATEASASEASASDGGAPVAAGEPRRDEVDRIVADWRRERPDLALEPLEVFSRVTRLARHLDLARRAAFTGHELDSWEFDVLAALRRAGEPYELSPGALVTATLVTSGTMTNRIDRLEGRGLVERHRSPDDRRGVVVRLTADGRTRVDAAFTDLLAHEADMLKDLGPERRPELAALLRILIAQFDEPGRD